jgi:hypothetical protein
VSVFDHPCSSCPVRTTGFLLSPLCYLPVRVLVLLKLWVVLVLAMSGFVCLRYLAFFCFWLLRLVIPLLFVFRPNAIVVFLFLSKKKHCLFVSTTQRLAD